MPAKARAPLPSTYEAALEELEQLLAQIESGQLPLEQLLAGYQRGAQLLAFCRSRLQAVQQQIQVLDGDISRSLDESALAAPGQTAD